MKAKSKKTTAQSVVSTTTKKAKSAKRGTAKIAKAASTRSAIQGFLGSAKPYAIPGAGVLATAALAATGYVLRNGIASFARDTSDFARDTSGRGVAEVLRMLHLERRSMHWMSTLGAFAGGIAVGAIASALLVPRIAATVARATDADATSDKVEDTTANTAADRKDGVAPRVANGSTRQTS